MKEKKIEFKQTMKTGQLVEYFQDIIKSFKEGKVVVAHEDEHVELTPPDIVLVEIEAKQKKNSEKFSLEIFWMATSKSKDEGKKLCISSEIPEPAEEEEKPDEPEVEKAEKKKNKDD